MEEDEDEEEEEEEEEEEDDIEEVRVPLLPSPLTHSRAALCHSVPSPHYGHVRTCRMTTCTRSTPPRSSRPARVARAASRSTTRPRRPSARPASSRRRRTTRTRTPSSCTTTCTPTRLRRASLVSLDATAPISERCHLNPLVASHLLILRTFMLYIRQ